MPNSTSNSRCEAHAHQSGVLSATAPAASRVAGKAGWRHGGSGSRRAHFKIYSTMTGKLLGEPKFETSL